MKEPDIQNPQVGDTFYIADKFTLKEYPFYRKIIVDFTGIRSGYHGETSFRYKIKGGDGAKYFGSPKDIYKTKKEAIAIQLKRKKLIREIKEKNHEKLMEQYDKDIADMKELMGDVVDA